MSMCAKAGEGNTLSPGTYALHPCSLEGQAGGPFLYAWYLEQCLAHSKYSINVC